MVRDVGQNDIWRYFFRFRLQKWTYLKLPLIEKNVADVRIILCSNKREKTIKFRIPHPEINYLGDFNGEDLVKTTFCSIYVSKIEV